MKIFVTGCAGFIGFHLVKRLTLDGHEVIGIDNNNNYYSPILKAKRLEILKSKNFSFIECDLNNILVNGKDIDIAINLAAQAGVRVTKEKEHLYDSTNVKGFESFCNFCMQNDINKLLYASSSSVYSGVVNEKFCETNSVINPISKYGKSKLLNEIFASQMCKLNDISMVGLRFFSVYGPFGRPDMAYYSFAEAINKQQPIFLNNKGNMFRDMTYIEDVVEGILGAIEYTLDPKNKNNNEIFNLGNDNPIKISYMLKKIEQTLGAKAIVKHAISKNEVIKTHADISKARNLLGYEPKFSFEQGIEKFLEWYKGYEKI